MLASATIGVVALSGCGTGADRARARAVTTRFFSALDARRGGDACAQLSSTLQMTIEQQHPMTHGCADAVVKVNVHHRAIETVHVYATSGRVDLAGHQSVFLSAMRDGWQIDALGCRPRASGPYACEEQG